MSKFCSECGARLKVGAKFCSACGHKVVTEVAQDSPPPAPMPYEKPKTIQEIFAEKKAAAQSQPSSPAPMPYESHKTLQEIYAEKKAAAQSQPSYSQDYSPAIQSSGGWWYETFLRRDGRLNRLRFFKRGTLSTLISATVALIIVIILNLDLENNPYHIGILSAIFISLETWLDYGLIVRRSHDLSKNSPWYKYVKDEDEFLAKVQVGLRVLQFLVVIFVPRSSGAAFIFNFPFYMLCGAKGEVGANEYGPDPLERRYY